MVVVGGCLVLLVVLLAWKARGRWPGRRRTPRVRILLVGARESGKTLLLTAMHHDWREPGRDQVSVLLRGPHAAALSAQAFALTSGDPPSATLVTESRDYSLRFRAHHQVRPGKALTIDVRDYAGEWLTKPDAGPDPALRKYLTESDLLLGILDGDRLLAAMGAAASPRRRPAAEPSLRLTIDAEITRVVDALQANDDRPLSPGTVTAKHLVITKWDRFEAAGVTYPMLRGYLQLHPVCRKFLENAGPGKARPRVIPVSAWQPGREPWTPEGVAAPFACALADALLLDVEAGARAARLAPSQRVDLRRFAPVTQEVLRVVSMGVALVGGPHGVEVPLYVLERLLEALTPAPTADSSVPEPVGPDRGTSTGHLLRYFGSVVERFEQQFPEQDVWPEWPPPAHQWQPPGVDLRDATLDVRAADADDDRGPDPGRAGR